MHDFIDQKLEELGDLEAGGTQLLRVFDVAFGVEKFNATDLFALRSDLLQSGTDSFQAAELVTSFLSGRGYGISNTEARGVASNIDDVGCTVERIQAELERVAYFA